jgi:hypothetical protein
MYNNNKNNRGVCLHSLCYSLTFLPLTDRLIYTLTHVSPKDLTIMDRRELVIRGTNSLLENEDFLKLLDKI